MIVIAGPCVIESKECLETVAEKMCEITCRKDIDYYFKSSFDKANRSSIDSYRGPGLEKGLGLLQQIKDKYSVKIATDIHEPWQAKEVAKVADILQIPAYLSRQTDLLVAAAETGKLINVKKGQFMAPDDMQNVIKKIKDSGNDNIMLCERGSCFGYHSLTVDMAGIYEMSKMGYPVIYDATHSVQKPGGNGNTTGGNPELIEPLTLAAFSAGAKGLFFETHPNPAEAKSDGTNMLPLDKAETFLDKVMKIKKCVEDL